MARASFWRGGCRGVSCLLLLNCWWRQWQGQARPAPRLHGRWKPGCVVGVDLAGWWSQVAQVLLLVHALWVASCKTRIPLCPSLLHSSPGSAGFTPTRVLLHTAAAATSAGPPGTPEAAGAVRRKVRVYVFHRYSPAKPAPAAAGAAAAAASGDGSGSRGAAAGSSSGRSACGKAAAAAAAAEPASWQLTISGRLLPQAKKEEAGAAAGAGAPGGCTRLQALG